MVLPTIVRLVVFAALWVIIVEADPTYVAYGLIAVPVAAGASLAWLPPDRTAPGPTGRNAARRLLSTVGLLGWLGVQSVRGGVDVARRSLARPVRVDPLEVVVPVRLTGGAKAVALAVLGLMPGTIVAEVREEHAVVHTLSPDLDAEGTWHELQRRVERVVSRP
jgi:multicomponent Na+:H+ antiporter subunit E